MNVHVISSHGRFGLTIEAGLVGEGETFPREPGTEGSPCDDILCGGPWRNGDCEAEEWKEGGVEAGE